MSHFHPHKKHGERVQENAEDERERLLFFRNWRLQRGLQHPGEGQ